MKTKICFLISMMTMKSKSYCLKTFLGICLSLFSVAHAQEVYRVGMMEDVFSCGLRRVVHEESGKIGFQNKKGEIVIPIQYCQADRFRKKKCAVCVNAQMEESSFADGRTGLHWTGGKWGVIDKKGNVVKPCRYDRRWIKESDAYVYTSAQDSFMVTKKGKLKNLK